MALPERGCVLILGGGPAGLATALSLAAHRISVVVVERTDYGDLRIGEHLCPEGVRLLQGLGSSALHRGTHVQCAGVDAWWGSTVPNHMDYLFRPAGYGLNLTRPAFDSTLAKGCRDASVRLLTGGRLLSATRTNFGWRTTVARRQDVTECRPDLIVDATGRSAAFARLQGSSIKASDSQVALVAFRSSEPPFDPDSGRVLIESTQHGWWYFAPLRGGRCVCMFMTDADLLKETPGTARAIWEQELGHTYQVRARVAPYPVLTHLVVRAARSQRLDRLGGPGWLAVGDAAISFDPLSSRGIAKGIEHGMRAAQAILAHFDGDGTAVPNLADEFAAEFAEYEQTRRHYYSIECRWSNSLFWRRRRLGERLAGRSRPRAPSGLVQ